MAITIFSQIFQHVDQNIITFTSDKAQSVVQIIEPTVVAGMGIVLILYGYLHWKGEIERPFMQFVDTVVKMGVISGIAFSMSEYNTLIIDTFQNSPMALASAFSTNAGAASTLSQSTGALLDGIASDVWDAGISFFNEAGIENIGGYLIPIPLWLVGGAITVYTAFLILLGKVYAGIMLALGPLFITALLFEKTKAYFANFINTLIYSGFVIVLAVAVEEFIISMFATAASRLHAEGAGSQAVDVFIVSLTGSLGLLVLMQVTSIASSLAGGVQLSTMGVGRKAGGAAKSAMDKITNKRDRDNKRAAQDQLDIQQHKEKLVQRVEDRKRRRAPANTIQGRTGTED